MKKVVEETEHCKKIKNSISKKKWWRHKKRKKDFKIAGKLHGAEDAWVSHHYHEAGKYRGYNHKSCDLNFRLTYKMLVFYNIRGF